MTFFTSGYLTATIYDGFPTNSTVIGYGSSEIESGRFGFQGFLNLTFPGVSVNEGATYSFTLSSQMGNVTVRVSHNSSYAGGRAGAFNESSLDDNALFQTYMPPTIDACQLHEHPCGGNSTCSATGHCTYSCSCNSGYSSAWSNGTSCEPINDCLDEEACDSQTSCVMTGPGTHSCGKTKRAKAHLFSGSFSPCLSSCA